MKHSAEIQLIAHYLAQYKRRIYGLMALSVIGAAITAAVPFIYGRLVDRTLGESAFETIGTLIFLWLILNIIENCIVRIVATKGGYVAYDASNDFLLDLSSHVIELPLQFHRTKRLGKIGRRIDRAAESLWQIVEIYGFDLLPQLLMFIAAFLIMFFIEWRVASIMLLVIAVYIFITRWRIRYIIMKSKRMYRAFEYAWGSYYDILQNIDVVKTTASERRVRGKHEKLFRGHVARRVKSHVKEQYVLNFWQQLAVDIGSVLIFGAAMYLLKQGTLTTGEFVMFFGYFSVIRRPIQFLGWFLRMLQESLVAIERGRLLLKIKPERRHIQKGKKIAIHGDITFQDVHFRYEKEKPVLEGISFSVQSGQVIALVGESGVGKTTIVDLVSGFYKPQSGQILIDGNDIHTLNLEHLRSQYAVVPQEITLFNDTIFKNIRYGRMKATEEEVATAAKAANAQSFINKFHKKFSQIVGERGVKLSTGQKQRLAIARAILRDPKILILDEATAALDSASERLVQDALKRLIKGRTTFVIAHRLSTITHADKILVLEKGRISGEGTHDQLIESNETYRRFFELQQGIIK